MVYTLEYPHPGIWDTAIDFFPVELMHIPSPKDLNDIKLRNDTIEFIFKVKRHFNLDSKLTYLAINYLDRSLDKIPSEQIQDAELVGTACFSLAARTLRNEFSASNLKEIEGFKQLDDEALSNKQLEVRDWLGSDMNSITPFAFLYFYSYYYVRKINNYSRLKDIEERASDIFIQIQSAVEFLDYRPSAIAAAALFCAVEELFPRDLYVFVKAVYNCGYCDRSGVEDLRPKMKATLENISRSSREQH